MTREGRLTQLEAVVALRRDLMTRASYVRATDLLAEKAGFAADLFAMRIERQICGVFGIRELRHHAATRRDWGRLWGGCVTIPGYVDVEDSRPLVTIEAVAITAASLEGRLLALLPVTSSNESEVSPDQTLADKLFLSPAAVRQTRKRTLNALGLSVPPSVAVRQQRRRVSGGTQREQESQRRRDDEAARKRRFRAHERHGLSRAQLKVLEGGANSDAQAA